MGTKDSIVLSREEAYRLHRQMWLDMQAELGDNPIGEKRIEYKMKWCIEHGYSGIKGSCFLCEYDIQNHLEDRCRHCIVDWSEADGFRNYWNHHVDSCICEYKYDLLSDYYLSAPISSILAIPLREE